MRHVMTTTVDSNKKVADRPAYPIFDLVVRFLDFITAVHVTYNVSNFLLVSVAKRSVLFVI